MMSKIEVIYPSWYDEIAEFEHEEKGYLEGVHLNTEIGSIILNFYDRARLEQDVGEEIRESGFFYISNIVIVESVTRANIEAATQEIAKGILK
jgi:hypothetical protein